MKMQALITTIIIAAAIKYNIPLNILILMKIF